MSKKHKNRKSRKLKNWQRQHGPAAPTGETWKTMRDNSPVIGKYGTAYAGGYSYGPACSHYLETHVFDVNKTEIWAGLESQIPRFAAAKLVIDCSNLERGYNLSLPPGFETLAAYSANSPVIRIPWPDAGAPAVLPEFWPALVHLLPEGRVYVCCAGSHGRTGTALVALRLQCEPITTVREAIEEIRKLHCEEAIETEAQINYLYALGLRIGGQAMVDDHSQPRPVGAFVGGISAANSAPAAAVVIPPSTRDYLPSWAGVGSEGSMDGKDTASRHDLCTDSQDADMLETWPLARTMTEEEITFYRAHDRWPARIYDEAALEEPA